MKKSDDEIRQIAWESRSSVKPHTWDEVFEDEQELIDALMSIKVDYNTKGYEFLQSFQRYINKGWTLSPKQMTQLKRLAMSILFEKYCRNQRKVERMERRKLNESVNGDEVTLAMWTWKDYNGDDDAQGKATSFISLDEAREYAEKYAEDEPFIADVDDYAGLPEGMTENLNYANVEDFCDEVEKFLELDDTQRMVCKFMIDNHGYDIDDAIEFADRGDYFILHADSDSKEDLARAYIDELGGFEVAVGEDYMRSNFDWKSYERDIRYDEENWFRSEVFDSVDFVDSDECYDAKDDYLHSLDNETLFKYANYDDIDDFNTTYEGNIDLWLDDYKDDVEDNEEYISALMSSDIYKKAESEFEESEEERFEDEFEDYMESIMADEEDRLLRGEMDESTVENYFDFDGYGRDLAYDFDHIEDGWWIDVR